MAQQFYAPAFRVLESADELRLVAHCDTDPRQLAQISVVFPGSVAVQSIDQLVANQVDLAIVASPPRYHAEQTLALLAGGKSVLCEKPMAGSIIEAEAMIAAAKAHARILAVGLYKRFFPACESIKGLIEHQPLGRLLKFQIQEGGRFGWQPASASFFDRSQTPGGVLLDIGVHVLDLLLWWLDEPPDFSYEDDAMGGQEANCRLELHYADGCTGTVQLSRDWETANRYTFWFERGTVRYRVNEANRLEIVAEGMPAALAGALVSQAITGHRQEIARSNPQSFVEQLRNVIAAIQGREPLRVSGEEGIRSLRLIERCYAQRRLMAMPWLSGGERNQAELLSLGKVQEAQPA